MATNLNKTLIRETTVIRNERPVYVLLTENQRVELRLQRERSTIGISIADLYDQLNGSTEAATTRPEPKRAPVAGNLAKFIQDVKDQIHIDGRLTYEETCKLNKIFTEIVNGE